MDRRYEFSGFDSTLGRAPALSAQSRRSRVTTSPLPKPVPGRLFAWVKRAAWVESALFAALLVVWIAPGLERATFLLGLSHGIGYLALCALLLIATIARETPWPLLAASLTPAGPFGTVIGIALIERRGWGVATNHSAGIDIALRNRR